MKNCLKSFTLFAFVNGVLSASLFAGVVIGTRSPAPASTTPAAPTQPAIVIGSKPASGQGGQAAIVIGSKPAIASSAVSRPSSSAASLAS